MSFEDDFIKGWRDCEKGLEHQHKSEAYNRGYAAKYQSEQVATEMSRHGS